MERSAKKKLETLGLPESYEGFSYLCSLMSKHKTDELPLLTMKEVEAELSGEYGVSGKAIKQNLTLFAKRAWSGGVLHKKMNWQAEPTLKEFVFSVLVLAEYQV